MPSRVNSRQVFVSSSLAQRDPPIIVCLEQDAKAISHESAENPSSGVTSDNLAYVCFTSGSTGRPKGVSIPHRGVARLVKNTNYIAISTSDVFLQFAPVSFDASTFRSGAAF